MQNQPLHAWQHQHQGAMAHLLSIPEMNDPHKAIQAFTLAARGKGPTGPSVQQVKSMAMWLYVWPGIAERAQATGQLSTQDQRLLIELTAPFECEALDKQGRRALSRKDLAALDGVMAQLRALQCRLADQGSDLEASTVLTALKQLEAQRPAIVYVAPPAVPHPDAGRVPTVVVAATLEQSWLPDEVATVARKRNISTGVARTVMFAYGTQTSTPDLLFYLEQTRGLPRLGAQELVTAIRRVRTRSDKAIFAWAQYVRTLGRVVSSDDCSVLDLNHVLGVQPEIDTRGHRALVDVFFDAEVEFCPDIRSAIREYLEAVGYRVEYLALHNAKDQQALEALTDAKRRTLASSLTALNIAFNRLVLRTGRMFQVPVQVGLIDQQFDESHGAIALNIRTTRVGDERHKVASERHRDSSVAQNHMTEFGRAARHGTGMAGVALDGKHRWIKLSVVATPLTFFGWQTYPFGNDIHALVQDGSEIIGISLSTGVPQTAAVWHQTFERHPNVLFVVAAYDNEAVHTSSFPEHWRQFANHSNVLVIGNVDLTDAVNLRAAYGPTLHLNALGSHRNLPLTGGGYNRDAGASVSTQAVVNIAASIRFLAPTLPISGIRQILQLTSKFDPRSTLAPEIFPMQGVVHGDDADKVAAVVGLVLEQRRPEQWQITGPGRAADAPPAYNFHRTRWHAANATDPVTAEEAAQIAGLSAEDQQRLLPIAQRVLNDHAPAAASVSKQPR